MALYRLLKTPITQVVESVVKKNEEKPWEFIPFDDSNCDYQEYLKWLVEGNTPDPAE